MCNELWSLWTGSSFHCLWFKVVVQTFPSHRKSDWFWETLRWNSSDIKLRFILLIPSDLLHTEQTNSYMFKYSEKLKSYNFNIQTDYKSLNAPCCTLVKGVYMWRRSVLLQDWWARPRLKLRYLTVLNGEEALHLSPQLKNHFTNVLDQTPCWRVRPERIITWGQLERWETSHLWTWTLLLPDFILIYSSWPTLTS